MRSLTWEAREGNQRRSKRMGEHVRFLTRIHWARSAVSSITTLALISLILTVEGGCSSRKQLEQRWWHECEVAEEIFPCEVYLDAFSVGLHAGAASDRKHHIMWKNAEREDSILGYRQLLDQIPRGDPNYSVVAARLEKLEKEDNLAWARALKSGTVSAFEEYLRRQGTLPHAEEAAKRLDDKMWQAVRRSDTNEAYQKYLSAHPNGAHVAEARQEIEPTANNCVVRKLKAQGYNDRINCMIKYHNPICTNISRYNAKVDAFNECNRLYR